jgi:hypothetical protein
LRQAETDGVVIRDLRRKHNIIIRSDDGAEFQPQLS